MYKVIIIFLIIYIICKNTTSEHFAKVKKSSKKSGKKSGKKSNIKGSKKSNIKGNKKSNIKGSETSNIKGSKTSSIKSENTQAISKQVTCPSGGALPFVKNTISSMLIQLATLIQCIP